MCMQYTFMIVTLQHFRMLKCIIITTLVFTYWDLTGSQNVKNRFYNDRIQWKNLNITYWPYKLNKLDINPFVLFFDLSRSMIKTALPHLKRLEMSEDMLGEIFELF